MKPETNKIDPGSSETGNPPRLTIDCRELRAIASETLENIQSAFRDVTPCQLAQAWHENREPDFAPATVRVGWNGDFLLLFAELIDADIHNKATRLNEKLWELGDVLEVFLRPADQSAYLEFHVSPENQRLQLRFADATQVSEIRKTGSVDRFLIPGNAFHSATWVEPENKRWFVFARIPSKSVCDNPRPLKGSQWHFSFSRYDYTRGREKPVISSTSPHTVPNFHHQHEWGTLRFV